MAGECIRVFVKHMQIKIQSETLMQKAYALSWDVQRCLINTFVPQQLSYSNILKDILCCHHRFPTALSSDGCSSGSLFGRKDKCHCASMLNCCMHLAWKNTSTDYLDPITYTFPDKMGVFLPVHCICYSRSSEGTSLWFEKDNVKKTLWFEEGSPLRYEKAALHLSWLSWCSETVILSMCW